MCKLLVTLGGKAEEHSCMVIFWRMLPQLHIWMKLDSHFWKLHINVIPLQLAFFLHVFEVQCAFRLLILLVVPSCTSVPHSLQWSLLSRVNWFLFLWPQLASVICLGKIHYHDFFGIQPLPWQKQSVLPSKWQGSLSFFSAFGWTPPPNPWFGIHVLPPPWS